MLTRNHTSLEPFISVEQQPLATRKDEVLSFPIDHLSPGIEANAYYFGHPEWAKNYLDAVHRDREFQERWSTITGSWQDKIVVDIGCGPGNVFAALRDHCGVPNHLIGVDVAHGGLKIAAELGYTPVLADAQRLPFISEFADIVVINGTLHHCDDMRQVLREAARIVRPGGLLITDHDLQKTMWSNNRIAHWLWNVRLPLYRLLKRGGHATSEEQKWMVATEVHHSPGDGVTPEFFYSTLEPMGFSVKLFPHNRTAGADVLQGRCGRSSWNIRLAQWLSGVNPNSAEGALVMMCVAQRSLIPQDDTL
ncbi:class I SAM-dependent methyltransferase [Leptolyngbya sp. DQ-M1]|uniref:class I SAM-dependent methyltransferase n=1 Tax=Leptolyngbya sp. DQ-M1 TaxID=2933920 RepID=UPI00329829B7